MLEGQIMIIDGVQYRQITGFPMYYIDCEGNVWSKNRGRHLVPFVRNGISYVVLCKNNWSTQRTIAKLVAEAFVPNPNPKELKYVRHKDGDTTNNSFDNLEWCTKKEMYEKKCTRT